jgi:hypothetical protein
MANWPVLEAVAVVITAEQLGCFLLVFIWCAGGCVVVSMAD